MQLYDAAPSGNRHGLAVSSTPWELQSGKVWFTPDPEESGYMYTSMKYAASDATGLSGNATIFVNVYPINDLPHVGLAGNSFSFDGYDDVSGLCLCRRRVVCY